MVHAHWSTSSGAGKRRVLALALCALVMILGENACLRGAKAAVDMGCRRKDDTPALLSLDDGLERRSSSPKTLFVKPIGNLLERLQAIASAATVAKSEGAELVVVWKKDGDEEFPASWEDLYRNPKLTLGQFPEGSYEDGACKIHHVESHEAFQKIQDSWEQDSKGGRVLCITSNGSFLSNPSMEGWFYQLLKPSRAVMVEIVQPFLLGFEDEDFSIWGQWIGIDLCGGYDCSTPGRQETTVTRADIIELVKRVASLPLDGEGLPRFLITSADELEALQLREEIWALKLEGNEGTAITFGKYQEPGTRMRCQEDVAELYMLGKTSLVIGSPGSALSRISAAMRSRHVILPA